MSVERERLKGDLKAWRRWGPYLAERAWGTVREDYSANGDAWNYFPHDHARSRAYRWNEDGLLGISDDLQRLCFALALWNGNDSILKERLFGVTGPEGNHGEDVKEYYYYLDATPTHSYLKALYKYPQRAFPYEDLVETTRARTRSDPEYELIDTGIFDDDRYFDVFVEYAKADPRDILIRITAFNRGPDAAELHLLPMLWYRNTWSWGGSDVHPVISLREAETSATDSPRALSGVKEGFGEYVLAFESELAFESKLAFEDAPKVLFTENETNTERLYGTPNATPHVKDSINDYVVNGKRGAVNSTMQGTKAALHYRATIASGASVTIRLRLMAAHFVPEETQREPFADFDKIFAERIQQADEFYRELQAPTLSDDEKNIQRQAFAGMIWSKQFYNYNVERWLHGDPKQPPPPRERFNGRNKDWEHLDNQEVLSMPDKWEYPWYAAWDLAFHCIPLAQIDPEFAKEQLILLGREWFQHPNGQVPAYEWNFSDVNPPVLAWAAWRVYTIDRKQTGTGDLEFLERVFHKLLLNFTWWVNRKDAEGHNVFQGGFLGLDNIGVFDRSAPLPTGGSIQQSDGTSWMGMFSIYMLTIALELATTHPAYEDIATKFFEHFLYIAAAMNNLGGDGIPLWDEEDEFFYDVLSVPPHVQFPLKVRSMVGIIPLFAATTIEPDLLERVPNFRARLEWFLKYRPEHAQLVSRWTVGGMKERRLVALLRGHRMKRILKRVLDPDEFLSEYGVRALSKVHERHPYELNVGGEHYMVKYLPGESDTGLFGGNSNWRGPIWFPVNYLILESLLIYHHYYGDDFKIECPTGSGRFLTLKQTAGFLAQRMAHIFARDAQGRRAVWGDNPKFQNDPYWRDYLLFYEYFDGDTGRGLGASHQTGWTGLIAKMLQELAERARNYKPEEAGVTKA
ncbi:MAG TPA: glucosidase [Anaerolineae bacterium]|nr:glucosidase [Anaerolineae bacterium]